MVISIAHELADSQFVAQVVGQIYSGYLGCCNVYGNTAGGGSHGTPGAA